MGVKLVVPMTDGDSFDHLRAAPPSGRGRLLVAVGPILPGAPTGRVVPVQIVRAALGALLPQLAGEGGPKGRMGYGPLLQTEPDCTDISGNLRLSTPAFRTPSGAARHLPRFAEKGGTLRSAAAH
jgi:hypothetical protein